MTIWGRCELVGKRGETHVAGDFDAGGHARMVAALVGSMPCIVVTGFGYSIFIRAVALGTGRAYGRNRWIDW